jgi:hypothetical protein
VAGGVSGVTGVDLDKLRKGAEERLGGIVKGVDLEKLSEWSRVLSYCNGMVIDAVSKGKTS